MKEHTTIKIWMETLKKLRLLSAYSGERMVAVLDRLITAELDRIERLEGKKS